MGGENAVSARYKMKKRVVTGAIYVAVVVAMFLLREYVDYRLFNLLTYFWTAMGTFEVARAVKPWAIDGNFLSAVIFGVLTMPVYAIVEYYFAKGFGGASVLTLSVAMLAVTGVLCFADRKSFKNFLISALPFIYPTLFMLTMLLANDLGKEIGFVAMLLIYVISPLSDTFAYFVGSLIGGKKLCPKLSPKKTWSGAIGGTIGGAVGSILVYIIFKHKINFDLFSPIILFAIIGVIGSIITIIGDLFESFVKRRAGIKDMGNILPGHGGAMDRMDGSMFLSVFIYFVVLLMV